MQLKSGDARLRFGGGFAAILAVIGAFLIAVAVAAEWEPFAPMAYEPSVEPVRPGQENSVRQATFADGRLWLLSDAGELWSIDPAVRAATREPLSEAGVDICEQDERLVVATASSANWNISRREAGAWRNLATVPSHGEGLVAAECQPDHVVIVSSKRLIEVRDSGVRAINLSARLPVQPIASVMLTPSTVFVGINAGEWGGGARRVDRRTGAVVDLHRNTSQTICGGPLNSGCDPVHGFAVEPGRPGCVLAAVGLVHLNSRGRIAEICGDQVRTWLTRQCPDTTEADRCSIAVFGLATTGETVWAIGNDGLRSIDAKGVSQPVRLPKFHDYGPFAANFDNPDLALVLSSANRRHSVSGLTPMVVPRRPASSRAAPPS